MELKKRIETAVHQRLDWLTELYKDFHAQPELSGQEAQTAAKVSEVLTESDLTVTTGIGGYGVVGIIDNGPGPTLLLRADMDALPVTEATGLPFASQVVVLDEKGEKVDVMHACGHDFHITCLLGAAIVLSELKDSWSGQLMVIAQPDEEINGGANRMLNDGLYERFGRPDFGLAFHVKPELPAGSVGIRAGIRNAGNFPLDVTIRGTGGHGAEPHLAKDPVVLAAQFVLALQTIVSREIDPAEMGLITVGAINGGNRRNIIPDEVLLNLTIRAYDQKIGLKIINSIERMAQGLALAAGLPENKYPIISINDDSWDQVINDGEIVNKIEKVFTHLLGHSNVINIDPVNTSEDFGNFGKGDPPIPLFMWEIGVTNETRLVKAAKENRRIPPLHNPSFYPDLDKGLPTGIISLTGAALELLKPENQ
jgi:amidohydrolase